MFSGVGIIDDLSIINDVRRQVAARKAPETKDKAMALKAITSWDGEIELIGVEDTEGGVWWPNDEAQQEIQSTGDPKSAAITMCAETPMLGEWSN